MDARAVAVTPPHPEAAVEVVAHMGSCVLGVFYVRQDDPRPLTAGSGPAARVTLPVALGKFPLVVAGPDGFTLTLAPEMRGSIRDLAGVRPLAEGGCLALTQETEVDAECGAVALRVRVVPAPERAPVGWPRVGRTTLALFAASALLHVLALVMVLAAPPLPHGLALDDSASTRRLLPFVVIPPMARPSPRGANDHPDSAAGSASKRERAAASAPRGGAGTHPRAGQSPRMGPPRARINATEIARVLGHTAGVLDVLGSLEGSTVAWLPPRQSAIGGDPLWHDLGTGAGTLPGGGPATGGHGGGGHPDGTIPLGGIGPIGGTVFSGRTAPRWFGRGLHHALAPEPAAPAIQVKGGLDREIVRRVIRSHRSEVRFCYEREAIGHPELGGRAVVAFTILPQGQVATAAVVESTTSAPTLDDCIAQAVRRWNFPASPGPVMVRYPFLLQMSGGR
jgi:TonB family protein